MKLIEDSVDGFSLVPENRREAQILLLWHYGKSVGCSFSSCNQWEKVKLRVGFDVKKGEEEVERQKKEYGMNPIEMFDR